MSTLFWKWTPSQLLFKAFSHQSLPFSQINWVWVSVIFNWVFCHTKSFLEKNSSSLVPILMLKSFSLYFIRLAQIIGKQPLFRITFGIFDKLHYNKVFYNVLVWSVAHIFFARAAPKLKEGKGNFDCCIKQSSLDNQKINGSFVWMGAISHVI